MTTSNNPINLASQFSVLSSGLYDAARGDGLVRDGTAKAIVAIASMLQAAHDDADTFNQIVRNVGGVHVNAKEQPEAFKASWEWWKEQIATYGKKDVRFNTVEMTADEAAANKEASTEVKRETNAPKQSAVRTLRIACSAAYALATTNIVWANVTFAKSNDAMFLLNSDMLRLFPKSEKTIKANKRNDMEISTFTTPNFKALVSLGNDALVKAKIKKAPNEKPVSNATFLTTLQNAYKSIEKADAKALNNSDARLQMYSLLVACIDMVNSAELGTLRVPNSDVVVLRGALEKMINNIASAKEQEKQQSKQQTAA